MKNYNTGIAAEYFVLSQLYRLGLEAHITLGNRKSIDIRIITKGNKAITLDVKAVSGYSSIIVNNATEQKDHFLAVVIYNDKFDNIGYTPEVFIFPSQELKNVTTSYKEELRILKTNILQFKDNWHYLQ